MLILTVAVLDHNRPSLTRNVSHAAQALGLSRSALYRRLEKHGL